MANREYIYARRCQIHVPSKCAVIVARSLPEHPLVPHDNSVVRVTRYESTMVIKAHKDFDSVSWKGEELKTVRNRSSSEVSSIVRKSIRLVGCYVIVTERFCRETIVKEFYLSQARVL